MNIFFLFSIWNSSSSYCELVVDGRGFLGDRSFDMESDSGNFFGLTEDYYVPIEDCYAAVPLSSHPPVDYNIDEIPPVKQRFQANARERCRTQRCGSQRFLLLFFIHIFWFLLSPPLGVIKSGREKPCEKRKLWIDWTFPSSVNSAFQILRVLIPTEPKDRKLSKIETLRLAKSYINHLATTLTTGGPFKRIIYWQFYWISLVLLISGHCQLAVNQTAEVHSFNVMNTTRGGAQISTRGTQKYTDRLAIETRSSICTFCVAAKNWTVLWCLP